MQFIDPETRHVEWRLSTIMSFNQRAEYHDVEFIVGKEKTSLFGLKGEIARHSKVFS